MRPGESVAKTGYTEAQNHEIPLKTKRFGSIPNVYQNFYPGHHADYSSDTF